MINLSMLMNIDELLIEIEKVAGYIFWGGVTGYGLRLQNGKRKEKDVNN